MRWFITFAVLLAIGSVLWPALREIGVARLPGDFVLDLGGVRLYLPVATSLLISTIVSLVWRLLDRP